MEEGSKRKKRIRRIGAVFFALLLFLTFFSNTIMNHSLAQVSTEQIVSDSVSAKVRGTGTVEAGSTVEITLPESREVEAVLVKEGDEVQKGEVLFRLKEGMSAELESATEECQELKEEYENGIMLGEYDSSLVAKAESGGIDRTVATEKLRTLRGAVSQAKEKAGGLQKQSDAIDNGTDEEAAALRAVSKAVEAASKDLAEAQTRFEAFGMEESEVNFLYENERTEEVDKAKEALETYKAAKSTYDLQAQDKEQRETRLEDRKETLSLALLQANEELRVAEEAHEAYVTEINTVNTLKAQYEAIREKEQQIEKLKTKSVSSEVKAEVSGRVLSVEVKKGEVAQAEMPLIHLQEAGSKTSLSFTVTKEQAAKVKKGDVATVADAWYYSDVIVTLADIKPDPENPSRNKKLTFTVEGDVEVGQTLTLAVGEKSTRYDYVVPNNAVREDNNGKFILIIREKSSPLGNRYIATRVDVEVLMQDDAKSALKAALEGGEFVITNANKMIRQGDYVRLAK